MGKSNSISAHSDFAVDVFEGCPEVVLSCKVDTFFLTINTHDGFSETVKSIAKIYNFVDKEPKLQIVREYKDLIENGENACKSLILTLEEPLSIGFSLNNLRIFYELGTRAIQLTDNKANQIGTGCTELGNGGLTKFGEEFILEMNKLGMLVDLSHCNSLTSKQAIEISKKPVVFSHANVNSVTKSLRNKSDEVIKLLADKGGVIGITPWSPLNWNGVKGKQPDLDDYLNHVEYVIDLVGIDHVGIDQAGLGSSIMTLIEPSSTSSAIVQAAKYPELVSSYYNSVGMDKELAHVKGFEGPKDVGNVVSGLSTRGYSEMDINKFLGGNMSRVLKAVMNK